MATSDHHQTDLTGSSHSHDDHHISRSNKYKGVRKRKWGKWVSEIRLPNSRERIWLGSYDTAEKAARAFDAALYCLRGRHAHFNFPDTPLELEIDVASPAPAHAHAYQSLSPQQIQEIASRFANQHHDDQNHHHHHHQLDPPLLQQSSSSEPAESDGVRETESGGHNMYDWSFLNSLDSSIDEVNFSSSNDNDRTNDLYSGLHKMHSGELYPASPPPLLMDHIGDANINEGDDALSQQSLFLWNF